MNDDEIYALLQQAYWLGFDASSEGYNAEFPAGVTERETWLNDRDMALTKLFNQHFLPLMENQDDVQ